MKKGFPENLLPVGPEGFTFSCDRHLDCFTRCCKQVDLFLFPYDVLRLKSAQQIDSEEFLRKFIQLVKGHNPYFPSVMLQLDPLSHDCPFLRSNGCSVYADRPSSCRTYPLERAVETLSERGRNRELYFLAKHEYCLGHNQRATNSVKEWVRNQKIDEYNRMNDLWAEMDALFAENPWRGEGSGGEMHQLAFMACYNIDGFRRFTEAHSLLKQYALPKIQRQRIEKDEVELLKFGFEWLKSILTGKSSLIRKR